MLAAGVVLALDAPLVPARMASVAAAAESLEGQGRKRDERDAQQTDEVAGGGNPSPLGEVLSLVQIGAMDMGSHDALLQRCGQVRLRGA